MAWGSAAVGVVSVAGSGGTTDFQPASGDIVNLTTVAVGTATNSSAYLYDGSNLSRAELIHVDAEMGEGDGSADACTRNCNAFIDNGTVYLRLYNANAGAQYFAYSGFKVQD